MAIPFIHDYSSYLKRMKNLTSITDYHAHVYFDVNTVDQARQLCEAANKELGVPMGRMHERPVGPHPMFSCQLSATPVQFEKLLPWLALNRNGLIVFAHPSTGDHLADHTDHAIWLGTGIDLDLSIFDKLVP